MPKNKQKIEFAQSLYKLISRKWWTPFVRQVTLHSVDPKNIECISDAKAINQKTCDLIKSAEKSINLSFFRVDESEELNAIVDALNELNNQKHEPKIKIKIHINHRTGFAGWFFQQKNPKTLLMSKLNDFNNLNIKIKTHDHWFFNCYHHKQIIIDGKTMMLRSGDLVNNPRDPKKTRAEIATIIEDESLAQRARESFIQRWKKSYSQLKNKFIGEEKSADQTKATVIFLEKKPSFNPFLGFFFDSPYKKAVLEGIKSAKNSINIMTPNINDPDILNALASAVKRGVTVNIVTGKYHNKNKENKPGMGGCNESTLRALYAKISIIHFDRLHVRWAQHGEQLLEEGADNCMHRKAIIFDDKTVITGSSVLDKQSTYFSSESDVVIESEEVAEQYNDVFKKTFDAGKDRNEGLVEKVKSSLEQCINSKLIYKKLKVFGNVDEQAILRSKSEKKADLLNALKSTNNLEGISTLLKEAYKSTSNNPFGFHRRCLFFPWSKTHSIKALKEIHDMHFNDRIMLRNK